MKKSLSILNTYVLKPSFSVPYYYVWFSIRFLYYISQSILPFVVGLVINELSQSNPDITSIILYISIYLILLFIFRVFIEIESAKQLNLSVYNYITTTLQPYYFSLLKKSNTQFWQKNSKGGVLKIFNDGIYSMLSLIIGFAHNYSWNFTKTLGAFVATLFIDFRFTLFFIVGAVLHLCNFIITTRKEKKFFKKTRKIVEQGNSILSEYITNYSNIFYLNLFKRVEQKNKNNNDLFLDVYHHRENITRLKWFLSILISCSVEASIVIFAIYEVLQGRLEVGFISTLILLSYNVRDGLANMLASFAVILEHIVTIERFDETMGELKNKHSFSNLHFDTFKSLSFLHVSLPNRENDDAIQDISFTINKGDKVAIIGTSGSGKSTLVDIILKSEVGFDGSILLNGVNFNDMCEDDLRDLFSIVPQDVQLFNDSIKNNILIGKGEYNNSNLDTIISMSCLSNFISKLPNGADSVINEDSRNISGGEKQRIGIARALAQNNPVLILDEATAALDPINEKKLLDSIISSNPNLTLIMISHKYNMLSRFDHIIVLHEGRIIEQGSFTQLRKKGGMFNELYSTYSSSESGEV